MSWERKCSCACEDDTVLTATIPHTQLHRFGHAGADRSALIRIHLFACTACFDVTCAPAACS